MREAVATMRTATRNTSSERVPLHVFDPRHGDFAFKVGRVEDGSVCRATTFQLLHGVMIAGLPFTALRGAILSQPTMVEGFTNLFTGF